MDKLTLFLNEPIKMRAKVDDFDGTITLDRFTFDPLPAGSVENLHLAINTARGMHKEGGEPADAGELMAFDVHGGITRAMTDAFDAARASAAA